MVTMSAAPTASRDRRRHHGREQQDQHQRGWRRARSGCAGSRGAAAAAGLSLGPSAASRRAAVCEPAPATGAQGAQHGAEVGVEAVITPHGPRRRAGAAWRLVTMPACALQACTTGGRARCGGISRQLAKAWSAVRAAALAAGTQVVGPIWRCTRRQRSPEAGMQHPQEARVVPRARTGPSCCGARLLESRSRRLRA